MTLIIALLGYFTGMMAMLWHVNDWQFLIIVAPLALGTGILAARNDSAHQARKKATGGFC